MASITVTMEALVKGEAAFKSRLVEARSSLTATCIEVKERFDELMEHSNLLKRGAEGVKKRQPIVDDLKKAQAHLSLLEDLHDLGSKEASLEPQLKRKRETLESEEDWLNSKNARALQSLLALLSADELQEGIQAFLSMSPDMSTDSFHWTVAALSTAIGQKKEDVGDSSRNIRALKEEVGRLTRGLGRIREEKRKCEEQLAPLRAGAGIGEAVHDESSLVEKWAAERVASLKAAQQEVMRSEWQPEQAAEAGQLVLQRVLEAEKAVQPLASELGWQKKDSAARRGQLGDLKGPNEELRFNVALSGAPDAVVKGSLHLDKDNFATIFCIACNPPCEQPGEKRRPIKCLCNPCLDGKNNETGTALTPGEFEDHITKKTKSWKKTLFVFDEGKNKFRRVSDWEAENQGRCMRGMSRANRLKYVAKKVGDS